MAGKKPDIDCACETGNCADVTDISEGKNIDLKSFFNRLPFNIKGNKIRLIITIIAVLWFLSGFYIVKQDETAVVRTFGAVTREKVPPGIKWSFPWPIEKVDKIRTTEIKHMSIGYKILDDVEGIPPEPMELQRLTGDTNIVEIKIMVQYQITDPADFLFNVQDPHWLIRKFGEAALTRVTSSMTVDETLTTGKLDIQLQLMNEIQHKLNDLKTGITIKSCNLQEVHPSTDVVDAFNDVSRAKSDKEKIKSQADAYRNELIPRARGEAQRMLDDAYSYRSKVLNNAKGEAEKFTEILKEYRKAEAITRSRLFLEMLEEVLPRVTKVVIEDKPGSAKSVIIK